MTASPQKFFWYELMTPDVAAARAFYTGVVGWTATEWGGSEGSPYVIVNAGERGVGGIMEQPEAMKQMSGGPAWLGYIHSGDVDAKIDEIRQAGGAVHRPPSDIPGVGRFSVVADPQGAAFMLLAPDGEDQPPVPPMTPGHVGWHELHAGERESAFEFYAARFGWTKTTDFDMGPMGIYQLFSMGNGDEGGMMTKTPDMPAPLWLFYFGVEGIDAAAERVTQAGGTVIMGPMEVPGGGWVLQATDPQGAMFALLSSTK